LALAIASSHSHVVTNQPPVAPSSLEVGAYGESDEDISPMHVTDTPSMVIPGPLTRARTRQLNQQVSSFLSSNAYMCGDGILLNGTVDLIVLRNLGEEQEGLGNQQGRGEKQGRRPSQVGGPIRLEVGLQGQSAPNSLSRPQTDSVFSDPHMPGKIKT